MPSIEDEESDLLPDDEAKEIVKQQMTQLTLALDGELRPLTPAVYVPPGVRVQFAENKTEREILIEELAKKAAGGEVTYDDEILRIKREVDPVGMAIAIVQGMQIPVYVPQAGGGVKFSAVAVSTRERMKLLHKLLDRQLPPSSPRKPQKDDPNDAAKSDPFGFLGAVERAAALARHRLSQARIVNAEVETRDPTYEESDLIENVTQADHHEPESK